MGESVRDKVLGEIYLCRKQVYDKDFYLKIDFENHPDPLKVFSNLWKEIADRGIKIVNVLATDKSPRYVMQLFSENGSCYIKKQLNDIFDSS